jgi:hypothetical protein
LAVIAAAEQVAAVDLRLELLVDLVDRRLGLGNEVDPAGADLRRDERHVLHAHRGVVDDAEAGVDEPGAQLQLADRLVVVVDLSRLVVQIDVERRLRPEAAVALRIGTGRNLRLNILDLALQGAELADEQLVLAERR